MKKIHPIILFMLSVVYCQGQQIVGGEYFFDTEPGLGSGISLDITPGDSIEFTADIPYENLTDGFHYLFIRMLNDSGMWSMVEYKPFFVQTLPLIDETIVAAEYFIDTEPGHGNATPLDINTPADSIEQIFVIPYNDLTTGFHYLFIRVKNQSGMWTTAEQRPIYVMPAPITGTNIVSGEFFVDTEPGVGMGTFFSIPSPADTIETDIPLVLPELPLGSHILYIRLRNEEGNWTLLEPRPFNICESYGPVSDFEASENGNMLVLENISMFADSLVWNFGDGATSELNDPIHFYSDAGVYNVSLFTFNNCGIDTLTIEVIVEGVENVSPSVVSNTSVSTLTTSGFGFVDGTTMKLTRAGFADIIPFSNTVTSSYQLVSTVNFTAQQTGFWNVEVEIPGEGYFTLIDEVEVINVSESPGNILMTSVTVSAVRTGRRAPATMHIQNNNFGDIIATPVFFRDIADVDQSLYGDQAPITQVGFFQETYQYLLDNDISNTVMEFDVQGGDINSTLAGFIIPKVSGQASYNVPFFVKRTISGTHQRGSGMIYPQLTSTSQLGIPEYQNEVCFSSFIKVAMEKAFEIEIDDLEWQQCFGPWNDSLYIAIIEMSTNVDMSAKPISYAACITSLYTHMAADGCIVSLPVNASPDQIKAVTAHVIANILYLNDAQDVALECTQLQGMMIDPHDGENNSVGSDRENEFCDLVMECGGMCLSGGAAQGWCLLFGSGIDPNTKSGPGNNVDDVFANPGDIAAYTISFENDSAATAPAEVIHLTDSLDAEKFDLESFEWGPIMISDSIFIQPQAELNHQVILKDLRPALPYYLLTRLNFDTSSAVIEWHFETLDTLNLQPLDLMLDGFLPPNMDGTEGAGDVSFFIRFSPELQTGDSIQNNAIITFDFNEPIVTDYWLNVVDMTAPVSAVNDLPSSLETTSFEVTWNGEDAPAGISSYYIYVSENDGPFLPWMIATSEESATYTGEIGSFYKFYSVATDIAANQELAPEDPWNNYDAMTQLVTGITELNSSAQLVVYPNPADNNLSLEITLMSNAMMRTEVTNILGEKLDIGEALQTWTTVESGTHTIQYNTSLLAPGVYFLRAYINDESAIIKFVRR